MNTGNVEVGAVGVYERDRLPVGVEYDTEPVEYPVPVDTTTLLELVAEEVGVRELELAPFPPGMGKGWPLLG